MGLTLMLTASLACIAISLMPRKTQFSVEYPGGSMGVTMPDLDDPELKSFQAKLVGAQCD